MNKTYTFLFISLFYTHIAIAQQYNMSNTPITDCSGVFNDPGGNNDYGPNQHFVETICSDGTSGTHVSLAFANVQLGAGDNLCFYDGTTTGAPQLSCVSDFSPGASFIIQATAANVTGCVTIEFTSDGSGQGAGWSAPITCVPACQTIISVISSADPAVEPADTGWIDVCPGQRIFLTGTGEYPQNGIIYNHSDFTSDFEWNFGDGDISYGPNASHVYNDPGGYIIQLSITDQFGCKNTNIISQRVRVSTRPIFALGDIPEHICAGDTINLRAIVNNMDTTLAVSVTPTEGGFPSGGIRSDSLPLPDGTGSAYETSISFSGFTPGQVLTNIDDLLGICVNMEHSWMRDLEISIQCPNGTSVILHNHPGNIGGQVFLGIPYEADEGLPVPIPGTGYDYCWTPTATAGTWIDYANANNPGTLPPGDYNAYGNLSDLIGCPLNGDWTIHVEDLWAIDNGFIFSWSINFNPQLYPNIETFTPQIVGYQWQNNPTIFFSTADSIAASPHNAGTANYVFQITDDFGCTYDTAVNIRVLPPTHPECYHCQGSLNALKDSIICGSDDVLLDASFVGIANQPVTFEAFPNYSLGYANHPPSNPYHSPIDVSAINPGTITNAAADIVSVCLNMTTDFDSDLQIRLKSPSGQTLELSTGNGGSADNYTNTCFTPTATVPITAGTAPFTGDFLPEGNWSSLNGSTINGVWELLVADAFGPTKFGNLSEWSITFKNHNAINYQWTPSGTLTCNNCATPIATPTATTTYYVHTVDSYSCELFDTATITLLDTLPAPLVECGTSVNGVLYFTWSSVPNAAGYEVSVDNGAWITPTGLLSHQVAGLTNGQIVNLQVRAVPGPNGCVSEIGSVSCTYLDCTVYIQLTDTIPIHCYGSNDGAIFVSAFNGQTPFMYTLDYTTTQPGTVFSNLGAGLHSVIVKDAIGCRDTLFFNLPQPDSIGIVLQTDSVSCFGGHDGLAFVSPSGGTGGFTYYWQGFPGGNDSIINVTAGTYHVTVTDNSNCQKSGTVSIGQPTAFSISSTADSVTCFNGSNGAIQVDIQGGVSPYTITWNNNQNGASISSLTAGTYTMHLSDQKGCLDSTTVTVYQPPLLEADINPTNALCSGSFTGTATVFSNGGISPYTYHWSNNEQSLMASNLGAGPVAVTVTDFNGCMVTANDLISEPTALIASATTTNTTCSYLSNGIANAIVNGGTMPYQYNWDNSQFTIQANGLSAGNHTLIVQDANGCRDTVTTSVGSPSPISLQTGSTPALCHSSSNGTASVQASGGNGQFQFHWSANNQSTSTATGLASGTYTVTVTDINNCSASSTAIVTAPSAISLAGFTNTMVSCNGFNDGTSLISASGGTGNFTYLWNDPLIQLSNPATNLPAGNYCVTVTDVNNCTASTCTSITQPTALFLSSSAINVKCFGGSDGIAIVTPSGGTPGYQYNWAATGQTDSVAIGLPQGPAGVTVTDAHGCQLTAVVNISQPATPVSTNVFQTYEGCYGLSQGKAQVVANGGTPGYSYLWSNNQLNSLANNLFATKYFVTVTDNNGCVTKDSVQITQLDSISINVAFVRPSCHGIPDGQIGVNIIAGGAGGGNINNYSYQWNSNQIGSLIGGLTGDKIYTVTATDSKGCMNSVSTFLSQPGPIVVGLNVKPVTCYGYSNGEISTSPSGDYPVFTYLWGANANSQVTQTATNLHADTYAVTVTDSTGCYVDTTVVVSQPTQLRVLNSELLSNKCVGDTLGSISVTIGGGTPGYQYHWSNNQTLPEISDLKSGLYVLSVTDDNLCLLVDTFTLTDPLPINVIVSTTDVNCYEGQDGSITMTTQGGVPPYSFSVDGQEFNGIEKVVGLTAGDYSLYVKDGNGCIWAGETSLAEPPQFTIDAGPDITISLGQEAQLQVTASGNQGLVDYEWTAPYDTIISCLRCPAPIASPLFTTTFDVHGIDEKGCVTDDEITVVINKQRRILVPTGFSPNGDSNNDVLLVHGASGATIKTFRIYDRWGELVYEAHDFPVNDDSIGWDGTFRGKRMNPGVFVWYVEAEYIDGEREIFKGNTTLIK